MKFFFLFLTVANAREVKIAWDAAPIVQNVTSWKIRSGDTITTSSTPAATLQVPNTETTVTVTAVNSFGDSPPATLVIPAVMLWIQRSKDLVTWENVVQVPYEDKQFIRIQLPVK